MPPRGQAKAGSTQRSQRRSQRSQTPSQMPPPQAARVTRAMSARTTSQSDSNATILRPVEDEDEFDVASSKSPSLNVDILSSPYALATPKDRRSRLRVRPSLSAGLVQELSLSRRAELIKEVSGDCLAKLLKSASLADEESDKNVIELEARQAWEGLTNIRQAYLLPTHSPPFPKPNDVIESLHPTLHSALDKGELTQALRLSNLATFIWVIGHPDAAGDLLIGQDSEAASNKRKDSRGRVQYQAEDTVGGVRRRNQILVKAWKIFWEVVVPFDLRQSEKALQLWLDLATQVTSTFQCPSIDPETRPDDTLPSPPVDLAHNLFSPSAVARFGQWGGDESQTGKDQVQRSWTTMAKKRERELRGPTRVINIKYPYSSFRDRMLSFIQTDIVTHLEEGAWDPPDDTSAPASPQSSQLERQGFESKDNTGSSPRETNSPGPNHLLTEADVSEDPNASNEQGEEEQYIDHDLNQNQSIEYDPLDIGMFEEIALELEQEAAVEQEENSGHGLPEVTEKQLHDDEDATQWAINHYMGSPFPPTGRRKQTSFTFSAKQDDAQQVEWETIPPELGVIGHGVHGQAYSDESEDEVLPDTQNFLGDWKGHGSAIIAEDGKGYPVRRSSDPGPAREDMAGDYESSTTDDEEDLLPDTQNFVGDIVATIQVSKTDPIAAAPTALRQDVDALGGKSPGNSNPSEDSDMDEDDLLPGPSQFAYDPQGPDDDDTGTTQPSLLHPLHATGGLVLEPNANELALPSQQGDDAVFMSQDATSDSDNDEKGIRISVSRAYAGVEEVHIGDAVHRRQAEPRQATPKVVSSVNVRRRSTMADSLTRASVQPAHAGPVVDLPSVLASTESQGQPPSLQASAHAVDAGNVEPLETRVYRPLVDAEAEVHDLQRRTTFDSPRVSHARRLSRSSQRNDDLTAFASDPEESHEEAPLGQQIPSGTEIDASRRVSGPRRQSSLVSTPRRLPTQSTTKQSPRSPDLLLPYTDVRQHLTPSLSTAAPHRAASLQRQVRQLPTPPPSDPYLVDEDGSPLVPDPRYTIPRDFVMQRSRIHGQIEGQSTAYSRISGRLRWSKAEELLLYRTVQKVPLDVDYPLRVAWYLHGEYGILTRLLAQFNPQHMKDKMRVIVTTRRNNNRPILGRARYFLPPTHPARMAYDRSVKEWRERRRGDHDKLRRLQEEIENEESGAESGEDSGDTRDGENSSDQIVDEPRTADWDEVGTTHSFDQDLDLGLDEDFDDVGSKSGQDAIPAPSKRRRQSEDGSRRNYGHLNKTTRTATNEDAHTRHTRRRKGQRSDSGSGDEILEIDFSNIGRAAAGDFPPPFTIDDLGAAQLQDVQVSSKESSDKDDTGDEQVDGPVLSSDREATRGHAPPPITGSPSGSRIAQSASSPRSPVHDQASPPPPKVRRLGYKMARRGGRSARTSRVSMTDKSHSPTLKDAHAESSDPKSHAGSVAEIDVQPYLDELEEEDDEFDSNTPNQPNDGNGQVGEDLTATVGKDTAPEETSGLISNEDDSLAVVRREMIRQSVIHGKW